MKKQMILSGAILSALVAVSLGTAAMADRNGMRMGGMMDGDMAGGGPLAMFDFAAVDADKDGKITLDEMKVHRQARIAGLDADGDGKISAAELQAMEMRGAEARAKARADRMLQGMDADGDGFLTAAELLAGPGMAPQGMFGRVDADNDGAITQDEVDAARDRMQERMGKRGRGEGRGEGRGDGRGHHKGHGHDRGGQGRDYN